MRFLSDNTASASPEILAALQEVNHGRALAYGDDEWTQRLDRCCSDYFGTAVRAFPVISGTAANALALATLSPPYGGIFAHEESHIAVDECGAPGFFSGGAQLMLLPGEHGRVTLPTLQAAARRLRGALLRTAPFQREIGDAAHVSSRLPWRCRRSSSASPIARPR